VALLIAASLHTPLSARADEEVTGASLIVNGSTTYTGGSLSLGTSMLTTNGGTLSIAEGVQVVASTPYTGQVGSTLEFINTSTVNSINTTGGSVTIGGSISAGVETVAFTLSTHVYVASAGTLTLTSNNMLNVNNTSIGSGALLLTAGTTAQLRIGPLAPVSINVTTGSTLNSIPTVLNAVTGHTVRFLDGAVSLDGSVTLLHLPAIANLASNPVELHMGNHVAGDKFVLQLSYNPTLAAGLGNLEDLYLGWFDPVANAWKNAIAANSDGGASNRFVQGAYNSATDFNLGTYGVDTANNVAWAVIDHNSIFGVANSELEPPAPAPEPTTAALLVFGGCAMLLRRRHRAA
jgi:hypothetical protein